MEESGIILNYKGPIDSNRIDILLDKLKISPEFTCLQKTSGKRVYSVLVECLENIVKYSSTDLKDDTGFQPAVTVEKREKDILVKAGNPVEKSQAELLTHKLDHINQMQKDIIPVMYEKMINREINNGENGAGLGFIIMRLKSGRKIDFSLKDITEDVSYFSIQISINLYTMRKLIIDQTANSPSVILDPENNIFEITGESRPPDVGNFYGEILGWIDDYTRDMNKYRESKDPLILSFDLEYFNSSSAKYILDFCKRIATLPQKGKDVTIRWNYEEEDMDMLEVGKELSRMAKFPFEYVKKI